MGFSQTYAIRYVVLVIGCNTFLNISRIEISAMLRCILNPLIIPSKELPLDIIPTGRKIWRRW